MRCTVTISREDAAYLRALGTGNVSVGVRALVALVQRMHLKHG